MAPFACARRVYGAQPGAAGALGLRTAAAAVGYCTKASGRSWYGELPGGRLAPAFSWSATIPPCRVGGHAPPGARRASRALEDVKKVLTDSRTRRGAHVVEHPWRHVVETRGDM
jgi:hypothetical protein